MTSGNSAARRCTIDSLLHVALAAALTTYYVFQCTVGTYHTLTWKTAYYDLAAEGFRLGQLRLPVEPSPALLHVDDPFELRHKALWFWDTVLFNKHLYIYWGPVPALCVLAVKLLGLYKQVVHDQWLVLAFMLGRLYAGAALIWSLAARPTRSVPMWTSLAATLAFALAGPTPYMMARPLIYEASIAAGQCFVFIGLLAAFWAIERGSLLLGVAAGLSWGLSLNSRVTWIVVVPLLAACCAYAAYRRRPYAAGTRRATATRFGAAFGLPIAASIGMAAWYNYARFGAVTDFGMAHQLTGRRFIPEARFVLPNVLSYLLAQLDWSCRFPFVRLPAIRELTGLIEWPADYDSGNSGLGERVAGLLNTVPMTWLLLLLVGLFLPYAVGLFHKLSARMPRRLSLAQSSLLACGLICLLSLVPALTCFTASMRYLEDPVGGIIVASYLACFPWLQRAHARSHDARSRLVTGMFATLSVYSICVGVALGFTGYLDNFSHENPALYTRLQSSLSVCTPRRD